MQKSTSSSGENVPDPSFPSGSVNLRYMNSWRWQNTSHNTYIYTLEYEAGGVSSTLFDDLELKFDLDPRQVTFVI